MLPEMKASDMGRLIQKNLRSFITVKAHRSMTQLKQQKSFGFFQVLHWAVDVIEGIQYIY